MNRLINTAEIAFGSPPVFSRFAPQQPQFITVIARVVEELPGILEAEANQTDGSVREEKRPLEWGSTEAGVRILSGETWHERA